VRDAEPAAGDRELLDVPREQPVRPPRRGTGRDRAGKHRNIRTACGSPVESLLRPGDRRRADDLPYRLIEERSGSSEQLRDDGGDVRRLAPVERPVARRHELWISDGHPPSLAQVAGGLEIDEHHAVVWPDHDVEHVQVIEDHRVGIRGQQRVPGRVAGVERASLDVLLDEEVMAAGSK